MYFLSDLSIPIRLSSCVCVTNLNAILAKLACCFLEKVNKIEESLAEADLHGL